MIIYAVFFVSGIVIKVTANHAFECETKLSQFPYTGKRNK